MVDIELPYYYEHVIDSEHSSTYIYGKLTDTKATVITYCDDRDDYTFELELREFSDVFKSTYTCYFKEENKSNEQDYLKYLSKAKEFLNEQF